MARSHHDRKIGDHELRPESLMMSYGYEPAWSEGAVKPPIFQTSTFTFKSAEEGKEFFEVAYGLREKKPGEKLGRTTARLCWPSTTPSWAPSSSIRSAMEPTWCCTPLRSTWEDTPT